MSLSLKLNGIDLAAYFDDYLQKGIHHAQEGKTPFRLLSGGTSSGPNFQTGNTLQSSNADYTYIAHAKQGEILSYNSFTNRFRGTLSSIEIGKTKISSDGRPSSTLEKTDLQIAFDAPPSRHDLPKLLVDLRFPSHKKLADFIAFLNARDTVQSGTAAAETFRGFAKHDTFTFESRNIGHDTITRFEAKNASKSHDVLKFATSVFANIEAARAAATQVGADTVFTIDADNTITLKNVVLSSLDASDFAFV